MKSIILFFILLFIIQPLPAENEGVIRNYIHISKSEGISNNNIKSIHDDIYGRIWIGTEMGLNIYNSNTLVETRTLFGHDNMFIV